MDLAEAERLVRKYLAEQGDDAMQVVMAEYARCGTELVRQRVEIEEVHRLLDLAGIPDQPAAPSARVAMVVGELQGHRKIDG